MKSYRMSRRAFAASAGVSFATAMARGADAGAGLIQPVEGSESERFGDGSTGRMSEFRGADGSMIAAFVRIPQGAGPYPCIVVLHGGKQGKDDTYTMGRMRRPVVDFVAAGWAVVAIDYRSTEVPPRFPGGAVVFPPHPPIELNDTLAAVAAARQMPKIDGKRLAVMGGSHGGYVMSKVMSRADVRCGIICSPAIFDAIELWRALEHNVPMIQPIKNKIAEAEQKYGGTMEAIARNPEAFGYDSPMNEAAKVRGAVMIINGRNDTSSPPSVMEVWARKLRAAGKQVEMYMPDDAPHGFYFGVPKPRPETEEAAKRAVAFVRKHFDSA